MPASLPRNRPFDIAGGSGDNGPSVMNIMISVTVRTTRGIPPLATLSLT
jgi:hypothetical protein